MIHLSINDQQRELDLEPEMPLLWVLRDELGLTGTKFGCGIGACGACTVLADGNPLRSCVTPLEAVADTHVQTIEGLSESGDPVTAAVQQAWIDHQVPQCGYCQSGMIMAVRALLQSDPDPGDEQIERSISNICRCGTYPRVARAIEALRGSGEASPQ